MIERHKVGEVLLDPETNKQFIYVGLGEPNGNSHMGNPADIAVDDSTENIPLADPEGYFIPVRLKVDGHRILGLNFSLPETLPPELASRLTQAIRDNSYRIITPGEMKELMECADCDGNHEYDITLLELIVKSQVDRCNDGHHNGNISVNLNEEA